MARKAKTIPEMTDAQRAALAEFQTTYGEDWQDTMINFHLGKPEYRCLHLMHFVRQIRNGVTANPTELPDLRAEFAPASCPDCGGEGSIDKTPDGVVIKVSEVCERCGGKGTVFTAIDLNECEELGEQAAGEAVDVAGPDPTDDDGNSILPNQPLDGDLVWFAKELGREPTPEEFAAFGMGFCREISRGEEGLRKQVIDTDDELLQAQAEIAALTTQRDVLAAALAGEVMPDGHVRGCPARDNREKRCNDRCFRVRAALTGIEGIEI